jgi:transposase
MSKFGLYLFIVFCTIYFYLSNSDLPSNHIHHVIYHVYFRGVTAAQAAQNINDVYGQGSTSEQTCQTWFKRFCSGEINLEDQPRSGRPSELEDDLLIDLLKEDNRQTHAI